MLTVLKGKPQNVILYLCLANGIIFQPAGQMTKSTKCEEIPFKKKIAEEIPS